MNERKGFKKIILSFVLIFLTNVFWFFLQPDTSMAGEDSGVRIRWAFAALTQKDEHWQLETVGSNNTFHTGDRLKMMVELKGPVFVYVFHKSSQDRLNLLFPYSVTQLEENYESKERIFVPEGEVWFELDEHVGQEVFYLLASRERLSDIEALYRNYEQAESNNREDLSEQIVARINELKREHRELAGAAERPISIGGAVRSLEPVSGNKNPDITPLATELVAKALIVRTYTIDHR